MVALQELLPTGTLFYFKDPAPPGAYVLTHVPGSPLTAMPVNLQQQTGPNRDSEVMSRQEALVAVAGASAMPVSDSSQGNRHKIASAENIAFQQEDLSAKRWP